jgi:hypothetical protein
VLGPKFELRGSNILHEIMVFVEGLGFGLGVRDEKPHGSSWAKFTVVSPSSHFIRSRASFAGRVIYHTSSQALGADTTDSQLIP